MYSLIQKKTPVILQLSDTECGIAALAMVFSYFQVNISLEKLREKCGVSRDGCKAQVLLNVARDYGFEADAYKVELEDLHQISSPVIAYWNFNHYVVIKKINSKYAYINDPAHGSLAVSMEEFDKAFTGVIIHILPSTIQKTSLGKWNGFDLINQYCSGITKEIMFLMVCLILSALIAYLNSILSSIFTDQCIIGKNKNWLIIISILTLLFCFILTVTAVIQKKLSFKFYTKNGLIKASEILMKMLKLPILFYSLRQRSEVISVLNRAENIVNLLCKNLLNFILGSVTAVICYIFMTNLNYKLSLVSIIITIISFIIFYFISKINLQLEKCNINIIGRLYSHSMASIRNVETVKACGLEYHLLSKWNLLFHAKIMSQDKIKVLSILLGSLNKGYNALSMLSLLAFGSYQVANSMISIGGLMGYCSLHLIFYNSISYILQALKDCQSAYATNSRIMDIVSYDDDHRFKNSSIKNCLVNFENIISLTHIKFYYNINSMPVLSDINIHIKKGQHVAFVGATGSGKSSLAKLICGFYPPTIGNIHLFGNSINRFSAEDLAKICAYVSQDVSLFSGTLLDNLTFSNSGAEMSLITKAIETVCLNELINKRTLNGIVAEQGCNFSGGERQRIDIARALIQDTPILILDESTSALDCHNEKQLIENLKILNKTIIFVAHRLSTIQHCDQIFVMKAGNVIEQGSHQELMVLRGYYYSLVEKDIKTDDKLLCH